MNKQVVYAPAPLTSRIYPSGNVTIPAQGGGDILVGKAVPYVYTEKGILAMATAASYREFFPKEYKTDTTDDSFDLYLDANGDGVWIGYYEAVLGIAHRLGLYPLLVETFGAIAANAIMDLVIRCLIAENILMENSYGLSQEKLDDEYAKTMEHTLGFSIQIHDADWYGSFFDGEVPDAKITKEGIQHFLEAWSALAAKAHLDISDQRPQVDAFTDQNIVAHIFRPLPVALRRDGPLRGLPITYHYCPDAAHDDDAFWEKELADFRAQGIPISGVIEDSSFFTPDFLDMCSTLHLDYLVEMPPDAHGFQTMTEEHRDEIAAEAKKMGMSEEEFVSHLTCLACSRTLDVWDQKRVWSLYTPLTLVLADMIRALGKYSIHMLFSPEKLEPLAFCMFITTAVRSVLMAMTPPDYIESALVHDLSLLAYAPFEKKHLLVGRPKIAMDLVLGPLGITRETLDRLTPLVTARDKEKSIQELRTQPRVLQEAASRRGRPKKQPE